jgi:hypothetical protein
MKIKSIIFNFENILLIFWIGCLLSINSKISDVYVENKNYLNTVIVFLRIIFPVLVFLILIFFLKIKKLNLFILSYLIYATWQLIVYTPSKEFIIDNFERYHLILSMIAILLIVHVAGYFQYKKFYSKILYLSIFFIGSVSLYLSFFIVRDFIANDDVFYLYYNKTLISEARNLLQTNPRITGVSRMLGLLLLFIFSMYICKKKKKIIYNFVFLSIIFIISLLIYGMQSKGSYISILLLSFYYIFFFKDKIKKKLLIFFIITVLPIVSFETIIKIKIEIIKINNESLKINNESLEINNIKSRFLSNNSLVVDGKITKDYTTGRVEIWKRALKEIKDKKILLGYGPQADRFLLKSINFDPKIPRHFYDSNASNGLIYAYLCAGIIGLLFILSIYTLIFHEVYKSIFVKKAFISKNIYVVFSILALSFLSVRTVYENGYTYFGVDYVFATIGYLILRKFNLQEK